MFGFYRNPTQPLPQEVVANIAVSKNARGRKGVPVVLISVAAVVLAAIVISAMVIIFS